MKKALTLIFALIPILGVGSAAVWYLCKLMYVAWMESSDLERQVAMWSLIGFGVLIWLIWGIVYVHERFFEDKKVEQF